MSLIRGTMNVITYKALLISVALLSANPVCAAGWMDSYLPSWVARPIAWVGSYITPYMPASARDAQKIAVPLEKELSAAQQLFLASEEMKKVSIFPKLAAHDEDLAWLDKTMRANQEAHRAFLEQQDKDLDTLETEGKTASEDLKTLTVQAIALNKQFIEFKKQTADTTALVQKNCNEITEFDRHVESNALTANKKVIASVKTLDDLINVHNKNDRKVKVVEQEFESISTMLDRYAQHRMKKRQARLERKKVKSSASGMLERASSEVISTNLIDK